MGDRDVLDAADRSRGRDWRRGRQTQVLRSSEKHAPSLRTWDVHTDAVVLPFHNYGMATYSLSVCLSLIIMERIVETWGFELDLRRDELRL